MTARDHWQRLNAALHPHTGALWIVRRGLRAVASFTVEVEGLHVLARLCNGAADAIDSADFLRGLGCPEARKGAGIVLNPMEVPYADPR